MDFLKKAKKLSGEALIEDPLWNKSTAFSEAERKKYQLHGLIPTKIETIEDQLNRIDWSFHNLTDPMAKHIFLRALQDRNETLFYRYLLENPVETMPIIYTPTVGLACQEFSKIYRKPRGIYLSYPERKHIPEILKNIKKKRDVKITVITDGERILGLGDQGVGGLGIPIGKLSLYCLLAGIHPAYTLPIILDVGTNNQERLNAKDYLGWRHERLTGQPYLDFVDECIQHLTKTFPNILIQFEDFAQQNANQLLNIYKDKICCFNDDIQGTAAIAGATLLSAIKKLDIPLEDVKIAIYGAGSAGCGIANLIKNVFKSKQMPEDKLNSMFYMIDRNGLIHDGMTNLQEFEKPFVQSKEKIKNLFDTTQPIYLEEVIEKAKPIALIGVSGQFGHFTEAVVRKMASYTPCPIIFPLSNPNEKCEATPQDILNWTNGKAIIATGSPFPKPSYNQSTFNIAQCNNAYIFPAMGLGIIAGKMQRVPANLFEVAAQTLANQCPSHGDIHDSLLPPLTAIRGISIDIATAIIKQAIVDGYSPLKNNAKTIKKAVESQIWYPKYW
jgi:malate dehydrogenase (oxaloacetate-decarboxylating)